MALGVTIKQKYVNMADIIFSSQSREHAARERAHEGEPIWDLIELLFFAYRDFVSDPDEVLEKFGFGRAHHRVLHFVNRNPGMKVADLLDILRITKQSLGRVLKQLVDEGYVIQKEGPDDRRHRLLFVTPKGEQLAMKLAGLQTERITRALAGLGPEAHEAARAFLAAMVDDHSREGMQRCQSLRQTSAVPILMLTAKAETESRINGLELGADDYVAKPFEPRELSLRIANILKRTIPAPSPAIESARFGEFVFHLARGELKRGEEIIHLTDRERDMLRVLAAMPGETVPRMALAGNGGRVNERAVDVQVNRLRRKIERDPANPLFVQTVRGIGYRLVVAP